LIDFGSAAHTIGSAKNAEKDTFILFFLYAMTHSEKNDTVSVIVPAYNAEPFLEETLQSILAQGIAGCEIIVVNDGSTDGTGRILDQYRHDPLFRILMHPGGENRGQCASTRLGLGEARGEFVAFLDSDDRYLPGKLARHIEILRRRPEVVLVHGNVEWNGPIPEDPGLRLMFRLEGGEREYALSEEPIFLRSNMTCNSTVVFRRGALDLADYPMSMIFQYQDWLLWNLLAQHGRFYFDDQPLTSYRYHAQGFTFKNVAQTGGVQLAHIEFYCLLITRLKRPAHRRLCAKYLLNKLLELVSVKAGAINGAHGAPSPDSIQLRAARALIVPLLLLTGRLWILAFVWLRVPVQQVRRLFKRQASVCF